MDELNSPLFQVSLKNDDFTTVQDMCGIVLCVYEKLWSLVW